jgi:hypothetical protein
LLKLAEVNISIRRFYLIFQFVPFVAEGIGKDHLYSWDFPGVMTIINVKTFEKSLVAKGAI